MLSRNVPEKIVGIRQKTTVSLIEKGLDKDTAMKKAYQDIKTMFPESFR